MTDRKRRDETREVEPTDRRQARPEDEEGVSSDAPIPPSEPAAGAGPEDAAADELARSRAEAAEYLEHLQRLKAEFDNYRKRMLREQTRAVEYAVEPLLLRLLEVLDEFELALSAAAGQPELEGFRRGIDLVYAKLFEILKSEGLERIHAEGEPFDPERHEALFQAEGEGEPHVAEVLRPGYQLKGRVIRPAGVKIARR